MSPGLDIRARICSVGVAVVMRNVRSTGRLASSRSRGQRGLTIGRIDSIAGPEANAVRPGHDPAWLAIGALEEGVA